MTRFIGPLAAAHEGRVSWNVIARATPRIVAAALALAVGTVTLLGAGCARRSASRPAAPALDPDAVLQALAAREWGLHGLRVSMRVRASGGAAAVISSPAYLAMDGPDTIWLQVLSPFGMTVLDLTIDGEDYELRLPMRGEVRHGHVDPDSLATAGATADERMVVALALLFRPKISPERCRVEPSSDVTCPVAAGIRAELTIDDALRPVRERYLRDDGSVLLIAEYEEYGDGTLPGRIVIRDPASDVAMVARVVKARTGVLREQP